MIFVIVILIFGVVMFVVGFMLGHDEAISTMEESERTLGCKHRTDETP